jgi:hypothetical protein
VNHRREELRQQLLREYAESRLPSDREGDRLFRRLFAANLAVAMGLGGLLLTVEITPAARLTLFDPDPVAFTVEAELSRPAPPAAKETPRATPRDERLPVITADTQLAQAMEFPSFDHEPPAQAPARRVYGVRQVFARGLGTGSGGDGGLVVKRGNTLDGKADTLTATEADLRGRVAPLSTVEVPPAPIRTIKPRYSQVLLDNRVSGVVSARLLVDVDGSVREVKITEDIGFDSREIATTAFHQFRFRPALRGERPVAVWILYKIRFEFQE